MRVELVRGFASASECAELAAWTTQHAQTGALAFGYGGDGAVGYKLRQNSRNRPSNTPYPSIAYALRDRIRASFGFGADDIDEREGVAGIVTSITHKGGDVFAHTDTPDTPPLDIVRCNIVVQDAGVGAKLHVGGALIDVAVGDLTCYLVTRYRHYVTENMSEVPRILWMFGTCVSGDAWDSGRIAYRRV